MVEDVLPLMQSFFPNFEHNVERKTKGWVQEFINNWELKLKKGEGLDKDRSNFGTTGSIKLWYKTIEESVEEIKNADPKQILDFDETMFQINQKGKKIIYNKIRRFICC